MTATDALILITEIKKTPYAKRIMKLSTTEWDFVNSIESWAKSGRTLTSKQAWKLQEIYRISQGHGAKRFSRVEG